MKIHPTHKPLLIFGSARSDGNTQEAISQVVQDRMVEIIDLLTLEISYFDYSHQNQHDDFIPLAEKMVQCNPLILATPTYWYTMSAPMKTFLDRWSDLLTIRKDLGRALAGKSLFVITSYATTYPIGYEIPFRLTCEYMDIFFCGCYYHYCGENQKLREQNEIFAKSFRALLWER